MHAAAYQYVERALRTLPFCGARVLEIGSYNINGSVRALFQGCAAYVGLDVRPGPGVDVVADGATYDGQGIFDIVVCCEVLEHVATPDALVHSAWRALRAGGWLILTAASPERAPHSSIDGGALRAGEHYAGIDPKSFRSWLGGWIVAEFFHLPAIGDVYVAARKPPGDV